MQAKDPADTTQDASDDPIELDHATEHDQALENAMETGETTPELTVDERVAESEREVLRAKAELENFRKRMQRESEQQLKYSKLPLVRDLLEVVDNLGRAIDAAGEEGAAIQALREGVEMVSQQLGQTLAKHGCQPIAALGTEFDPNIHEAISQMPSSEIPAGAVMQDVATGYLLHDRVVRPSQVIVSTGPADAGASPSGAEATQSDASSEPAEEAE